MFWFFRENSKAIQLSIKHVKLSNCQHCCLWLPLQSGCLPASSRGNRDCKNVLKSGQSLLIYLQGQSYYFVLKDNGSQGIRTGGTHWLRFLPNQMYCFLPSFDEDKGHIEVLDYIPEYLKDFQFCIEIEQVYLLHTLMPPIFNVFCV